ncbi:helix-turn-helix domain-containing protein [Nocardia sp. NPDC050378]|uniref:winged helix-turn-helix transcriptional regulator n=1 Tax=Nocardia sp. NPDC050378 TaxID=3155400 RepID=UPI0033DB0C10
MLRHDDFDRTGGGTMLVADRCAPDLRHAACEVRDVLNRIGDKWSVLVITELIGGARRFLQLHRSVPGISQRMLTVTLRRLERDGLVARRIYPTVPVQVEYTLTPVGRSLLTVLDVVAEWSARHRAEVLSARARWDITARADA